MRMVCGHTVKSRLQMRVSLGLGWLWMHKACAAVHYLTGMGLMAVTTTTIKCMSNVLEEDHDDDSPQDAHASVWEIVSMPRTQQPSMCNGQVCLCIGFACVLVGCFTDTTKLQDRLWDDVHTGKGQYYA